MLRPDATADQLEAIVDKLHTLGFKTHISRGTERTIVGVIGDRRPEHVSQIEAMAGVERVVPILRPFKLAAREFQPYATQVRVGVDGVTPAVIGGPRVVVIAGPCAIESEEQLDQVAREVQAAGASILRGGAYKPRTSPYSFQGLAEAGLEILAEVRRRLSIPVVTEVLNPKDVDQVAEHADMLQIGARNMQNFALLKEVGRCGRPVLLKRGMAATIEEWLMAAEYVLSSGNSQVVLCERGIRTFETATRNTLDLSAVAVVHELSHLPVIVDPSHGTGRSAYVVPMARAGVAAGADGVMVEVHPAPERALSDGAQSLTLDAFRSMMAELAPIAGAIGRTL
ncbi:3-deoxy-7-phosphoheptulonate synthase [Carboxydochorda subterranea]|uniref:3-deoxy-7-phosphoheptulonate synthase n=1 Tax=Carboxydichorda subterranea TaxID=3109565 RepID=A0ABZ1C1C9_9FIRM|nr:3-deoxy-7-phosphoheptulonate synthase [Limnochorda sp. L945t]WRP18561.1 3-deoxy-7-phosphoheptulonate synthase [Limnochorda sp. L945t]